MKVCLPLNFFFCQIKKAFRCVDKNKPSLTVKVECSDFLDSKNPRKLIGSRKK